jgi:hypothetical protein
VACHPAVNFLTAEAWGHAERRIVEVAQEHGTLDPVRLRRNLLSSMPMCFNMFGFLRGQEGFTKLAWAVFDGGTASVQDCVCEWAPAPKSAHLNDRSAFDAIVHYSTPSGENRFLGIETKC